MDRNAPQITAPITLAGTLQPAVVMFMPIFKQSLLPLVGELEQQFTGAIAGTVVFEDLARGLLQNEDRQVLITVSDDGASIYNEIRQDNDNVDTTPLYESSVTVSVFGRDWQFDIQSSNAFRYDAYNVTADVILAGGLTLTAMLVLLLMMQARNCRQVLTFADRVNWDLKAKSEALQASLVETKTRNEELQAFSYMVSHDLKAPLRGINSLTQFIVEDLEDLEAPACIGHNLERIDQQVRRANDLITGVLDYSRLGARSEECVRYDTREKLIQIIEMLDIDQSHLRLPATLPVFDTCATRLDQVLTNLIGNAFKYHDDPANARVTVVVEDRPVDPFYHFEVSDNGPGIDPRYHDAIFEVFRTLQHKDVVDSTGVGLAIVKKAVEQLGGSVRVRSMPGQGTTFLFDWPKTLAGHPTEEHTDIDLPRAA